MKNLIISHKEFQTAMFYCFSDSREIGKDLMLGVSHDNDKFKWEAFDGKQQIAIHYINRNLIQLNSVRPHDYNNYLSSEWSSFIRKIQGIPVPSKSDRRKDKIEDDHTLNDIIFEAYSEDRKFIAEGHDLWVLGSITGQEVEGEMKWGWIWQVFSQKDEQVFKYTIDMKDERLSKSSEDVVDYLNECFKEMVEMVKHDIMKGIIKI